MDIPRYQIYWGILIGAVILVILSMGFIQHFFTPCAVTWTQVHYDFDYVLYQCDNEIEAKNLCSQPVHLGCVSPRTFEKSTWKNFEVEANEVNINCTELINCSSCEECGPLFEYYQFDSGNIRVPCAPMLYVYQNQTYKDPKDIPGYRVVSSECVSR
jgi:hypothetical protein